MVSWSEPRRLGIYRDSSPISPPSPLSPRPIPQWLRPSKRKAMLFPSGRLKTAGVLLLFLVLGWFATSMLGPYEAPALSVDEPPYDTTSGGILMDPSSYGDYAPVGRRPGILGEDDGSLDVKMTFEDEKKSSLIGALSELHQAVTDKLQTLNPYRPKLRTTPHTNKTAVANNEQRTNTTIVGGGGEDVKDGLKEEDKLGARTRIGKCTILFNGNQYWERAIRTHEQHDRAQGYRLHVLRQNLLDDVWSKPAYILSLLLRELAKPESERLEWLMWVDADTIILNPYIPIETFLPPAGSEFDDVHLIYSNDWNGLNNGVFPIRVNQWSVELFSAIISFRYYRPETGLQFRDQSAMDILMHESKFAKHIVQVPQRWFNAYQGEHNETLMPFQIRRGDLLVHFAGVPGREERMGYWLERAEQHLDDWEIPVKSTSYPQEARDFWNAQRAARRDRKAMLDNAHSNATALLAKTDERLSSYADRLTPAQRETIAATKELFTALLNDANWADHLDKLRSAEENLTLATQPLLDVVANATKALLKGAHETIFAAERDLLDTRFQDVTFTLDRERISDCLSRLKALVLSPQDSWDRGTMIAAVNEVTNARATMQARKDAAEAKALAEEKKAKAYEEARKQAQLEADVAAGVVSASSDVAASVVTTSANTQGPIGSQMVVVQSSPNPTVEVVKSTSQELMPIVKAPEAEILAPSPPVVHHVVVTATQPPVVVWTTAMVRVDHAASATAGAAGPAVAI